MVVTSRNQIHFRDFCWRPSRVRLVLFAGWWQGVRWRISPAAMTLKYPFSNVWLNQQLSRWWFWGNDANGLYNIFLNGLKAPTRLRQLFSFFNELTHLLGHNTSEHVRVDAPSVCPFFSDSEADVFIGAYFHRYYDIHNVNGLDVHHPTPKFKRNSVGDTGFEVQRTIWAQGDYLVPGSLIVHSKKSFVPGR